MKPDLISLSKTIVDACNKRSKYYHDMLLGRLDFHDYSDKMNFNLSASNDDIKELAKMELESKT